MERDVLRNKNVRVLVFVIAFAIVSFTLLVGVLPDRPMTVDTEDVHEPGDSAIYSFDLDAGEEPDNDTSDGVFTRHWLMVSIMESEEEGVIEELKVEEVDRKVSGDESFDVPDVEGEQYFTAVIVERVWEHDGDDWVEKEVNVLDGVSKKYEVEREDDSGDESDDGSGDESDSDSGDESDDGSGDESDSDSGDESDSDSDDESDDGSGDESDSDSDDESDDGSGDESDSDSDDESSEESSFSDKIFDVFKDFFDWFKFWG